jgi:hypothetical protein
LIKEFVRLQAEGESRPPRKPPEPTRIKDLLREMVESGMINPVGENKSRRYIKA